MILHFYKYQGTGNDFIMIDNRALNLTFTQDNIKHLCNRRLGIGADGLIIIHQKEQLDFEMQYFNSDGNISSMCGNGGRCAVAFAHKLGFIYAETRFMAPDGIHLAKILKTGEFTDQIALQMKNVEHIGTFEKSYVLNTGSPHLVKFVEDVQKIDVNKAGREIRNNQTFFEQGINVNFVQIEEDGNIFVRTYERGVEEETLSCGTGVTASAIITAYISSQPKQHVSVNTLGGSLQVQFTVEGNNYSNIWLEGPATMVYEGEITF